MVITGDSKIINYVEPGYYEEGQFGIRLENMLRISNSIISDSGNFLEMEDLTFVPYQRKLIKTELLTQREVKLC
jgi:Xaa-Pro aminopeptidase